MKNKTITAESLISLKDRVGEDTAKNVHLEICQAILMSLQYPMTRDMAKENDKLPIHLSQESLRALKTE